MSISQITTAQLPLVISGLSLLVAIGSFVFTALNYRRGRPRIRAKLIVAKRVCWRDEIPRLLEVEIEVENRSAAETSVDSIGFQLSDVVDDACAETGWRPVLYRKFESEPLKGHRTFRREFRVPTEMPDKAAGNPKITAEIKLGTNKTLMTRSRRLNESPIAHVSHLIDDWVTRQERKYD